MSVDGIDYSKALAQERDFFKRASHENRETSRRDLKRAEDNYDARVERAKDNYMKAKLRAEEDYARDMDRVTDDSRKIIEDTKKKFADNLQNEREKSSQDLQENRSQFNKTLEDLSDSFRRSLEDERRDHRSIEEAQDTNHRNQVQAERNNFDKLMGDYRKNTNEKMDELQDEQNRNLRAMNQRQQADLNRLKNDEFEKRNNEVGIKNDQLERFVHLKNLERNETLERHNKNTRDNLKASNETLARTTDNFNRVIEGMHKDHERVRRSDSALANERYMDQEERNFLERKELKKKMDDTINYGHRMEKNALSGGESERKSLENKIRNMEREVDISKKSMNDHFEKTQKEGQEYFQNYKLKSADQHRRQMENLRNEHKLREEKKEMERDDSIDFYRNEIQVNNQNQQMNMDDLKRKYEDKMASEREKLNKRIDYLSKTSDNSVSAVREQFALKNKKLTKQQEKEKADLIRSMRLEFRDKLDRTSYAFEGKMQKDKEESEKLMESKVDGLNDKIKRIQNNRAKEIKFTDDMIRTQMEESEAETNDLITNKERQFNFEMEKLRNAYESRIRDVTALQEKRMKNMIETYDEKLQTLSTNMERISQKEEINRKRELHNLKEGHELNLSNLKTMYEDRIKNLKDSYEHQIELLKKRTV